MKTYKDPVTGHNYLLPEKPMADYKPDTIGSGLQTPLRKLVRFRDYVKHHCPAVFELAEGALRAEDAAADKAALDKFEDALWEEPTDGE